MARAERKPSYFPGWFYGPDGKSLVCDGPLDVPEGYRREPFNDDFFVGPDRGSSHDRKELQRQLKAKGVKVDPLWPSCVLADKLKGLPE